MTQKTDAQKLVEGIVDYVKQNGEIKGKYCYEFNRGYEGIGCLKIEFIDRYEQSSPLLTIMYDKQSPKGITTYNVREIDLSGKINCFEFRPNFDTDSYFLEHLIEMLCSSEIPEDYEVAEGMWSIIQKRYEQLLQEVHDILHKENNNDSHPN